MKRFDITGERFDRLVAVGATAGQGHGMRWAREYAVWQSMIQRCVNPNNKDFGVYGERGLTVCPQWRNDFVTFAIDMGERPKGATLERLDNKKGYCPDNCKWASRAEQSRNQGLRKDNTTGVRGVSVRSGKYLVRISVDGKRLRLGMFKTVEEAAEARKQGELKYWGGIQ